MNKKVLTLFIASAITFSTSAIALASPKDCPADKRYNSISHKLDKVNPNKKEKDQTFKLSKAEKEKKEAKITEINKNQEALKAKYDEVHASRKEINNKLDTLVTDNKKLTEEQYNSVKKHLEAIKEIQTGMRRPDDLHKKNMEDREEKDVESLMKNLDDKISMQKTKLEGMDKMIIELNEIRKIIG